MVDVHGVSKCLTLDFLTLLSLGLVPLQLARRLFHRLQSLAMLSAAVNTYRGMPSTGRGRPRPSHIRRGFIVIALPNPEQTSDATTDRAAATTNTSYDCAEGLANTWH